MNERRLLMLARMAEEVAELERAAGVGASGSARGVATPVIGRIGKLGKVGGSLLAVAAGLALVAGVIVMRPEAPTPVLPMAKATVPVDMDPLEYANKLFPSEPVKARASAHAGSAETPDESLVLAIVQDPSGGVQCVSWSREAVVAGVHDGLAPTELARQVCQADCIDGPHWLVAAKVTGPHHSMPADDDGVHALAECILDARHDRCDSGPSTIASGANVCVPAGLRVTVERRSMASKPRKMD